MSGITLFRVGDVELSGFDAPEVIGDLGGKQLIAFNKFPGGIISAQLFGRYPEEIIFTQSLDGDTALSKIKALDALVDQGPVVLQYGGWTYLGLVEHVKIDSKHEDEYKYTVNFKPVEINHGFSRPSAGQLAGQALLSAAMDLAEQQVTAPAAPYQFSQQTQEQVQQLTASVNNTISANQNNLYNVPLGSIQSLKSQISAVRSTLNVLLNGNSASAASAAADLSNTLQHMDITLNQMVPPQIELNVMNPNLFELAAAYYGDASKWDLIAKANSDLRFDPQPIGNFRITIPEDPGLTTENPLTFLP